MENKINNNFILKDSIFKIGEVISVKGRFIDIKVDKSKNTSHIIYKNSLLKNISVGGYVKILKGFTKIIGKIEGEYIDEDKFSKKEYRNEKEKINRILNVSLLGFFGSRGFERGIKELPLIGNECFLLEKDEFSNIHKFIKDGDEPITIGSLSFEEGQSISVGINSLFASHIGVFGNTGSGKSYTLAKIYRELFERYKNNEKFRDNSQFILIDFNGEYINDNAVISNKSMDNNEIIYAERFNLSTKNKPVEYRKFPLKIGVIRDSVFWSVFLTATEKTQAPFLKRTLEKKDVDDSDIEDIIREITTNEDKNIDKGIIFNFLKEMEYFLHKNIHLNKLREHLKLNKKHNSYYIEIDKYKTYADSLEVFLNKIKCILGIKEEGYKLKNLDEFDKIHIKIIYYYYSDIVKGYSNQEHLSPLIKRLEKRINDLKKVITIDHDNNGLKSFFTVISMKNTNIDMKKILPLLICKQLYDDQKKENKKEKLLNFIIDEAHNILSDSSDRESEVWKDYRLETFEEIIKEGRKFGVFLTISSQRPADISATIISQLHNYFLHRLINDKDIEAVRKTISYLDRVSFDYLPILPTGTCILAGLLAQVPVVVDIAKMEPEKHAPDNKTIDLIINWKGNLEEDK